MSAIIEKLSETPKEWIQKTKPLGDAFLVQLTDRRKELSERVNEIQDKLLGRGQSALEAGQKALYNFEETVLLRMLDVLEWAFATTGQRSDVLRRSKEYISDRLRELEDAWLEEGEDEEPIEVEAIEQPIEPSVEETIEETIEPVVEAKIEQPPIEDQPVQAEIDVKVEEPPVEEAIAVPIENYDTFNVKQILACLRDLNEEKLEIIKAYEIANKNRKSIISAIEKSLSGP